MSRFIATLLVLSCACITVSSIVLWPTALTAQAVGESREIAPGVVRIISITGFHLRIRAGSTNYFLQADLSQPVPPVTLQKEPVTQTVWNVNYYRESSEETSHLSTIFAELYVLRNGVTLRLVANAAFNSLKLSEEDLFDPTLTGTNGINDNVVWFIDRPPNEAFRFLFHRGSERFISVQNVQNGQLMLTSSFNESGTTSEWTTMKVRGGN